VASDETTRRRTAITPRERERLERLNVYEERARARGFRAVAGTDEVGRGALVGPVVAACVVVDRPLLLRGLNDSKKVRPERRVELVDEIKSVAIGWAIGIADVDEILQLNIARASMLAMERAIASVDCTIDYLISDAFRVHAFSGPQEAVIKGDALCASIAAASILAKVYRDALMIELDARHPHYGFAEHKGYGTRQHLDALAKFGPLPEHRRGFAPVAAAALHLPGLET
jgi:ribonuclease HII